MNLAEIALAASLLSGDANGAGPTTDPRVTDEQRIVPTFGRVHVLRPAEIRRARGIILFVSGDGGWNLGVVDMAKRAARSAVVVGLSMPAWRKIAEATTGACWYPAGELEAIAQAVEKQLSFPRYVRPVLVGYSSGATLVYGTLAQAPATTFAGAVSLGFCPDLEVARRFCGRADWRPAYDPKKRTSILPTVATPGLPRWTALHGTADKVCAIRQTAEFVARVPGATLVELPAVGHGFSVTRNWGAQFDAAIDALLESTRPWEPEPSRHEERSRPPEEIGRRLAALEDLPLEVQWPEGAREALIFLSGDGGWAEIDQSVAARLVDRGIGVVGWNSLRYFWMRKSPDAVRADLARVIAALPESVHVYAGGYSFGAEVVPVVLAHAAVRQDANLRRIEGLVLLAPSPSATFEVSPLDWLEIGRGSGEPGVSRAIDSLRSTPVLCLVPAADSETGCPRVPTGALAQTVFLPGGHHFGGDFDSVAETIRSFLARKPSGTNATRSEQ